MERLLCRLPSRKHELPKVFTKIGSPYTVIKRVFPTHASALYHLHCPNGSGVHFRHRRIGSKHITQSAMLVLSPYTEFHDSFINAHRKA